MVIHRKRAATQVCRDSFDAKVRTLYYGRRYSEAFKLASAEFRDNADTAARRGKRGCGARAVAEKYNESMLNSPNNCKLMKNSLFDAVSGDRAGMLPPKRGRKEVIPLALCSTNSKQLAMMQVTGEGEACATKIIPLIEGLTTNTAWDRTFTARACWWKALKSYPEIMNPVKAKNNKDRHVEWLSYKNTKDWTA